MKREIKFRAWHKATKTMLNIWPYEWREGVYQSNGEKHLFADNTFEFSEDKKECNRAAGKSVFLSLDGALCGLVPIDDKTTRSINYSDEYELMQFTGLQDRNGTDIYEGDIMQHANPLNHPFVVYWDNTACGFVFNDGTTGYMICDKSFEVIGNIHENPNLL